MDERTLPSLEEQTTSFLRHWSSMMDREDEESMCIFRSMRIYNRGSSIPRNVESTKACRPKISRIPEQDCLPTQEQTPFWDLRSVNLFVLYTNTVSFCPGYSRSCGSPFVSSIRIRTFRRRSLSPVDLWSGRDKRFTSNNTRSLRKRKEW